MGDDRYDHGQKDVPCTNCNGLGNVVQPIAVWNHQEKEYRVIERASVCLTCGGTGKVWI